MKKQIRLRVGDEVTWEGGPNEFRDWRYGKVLSIKRGIAEIDDPRNPDRKRKMPINRLSKKPRLKK